MEQPLHITLAPACLLGLLAVTTVGCPEPTPATGSPDARLDTAADASAADPVNPSEPDPVDAASAGCDARADAGVKNPGYCPAQRPDERSTCTPPDAMAAGCRYDNLNCTCNGAWVCKAVRPKRPRPGADPCTG